MDPFFDLEQFETKPPVESELQSESDKDEEERRVASERMLATIMKPNWIEKEILDGKYVRYFMTILVFHSFSDLFFIRLLQHI